MGPFRHGLCFTGISRIKTLDELHIIDNFVKTPADLAALKLALVYKFKTSNKIRMDIFHMKKMDIETYSDCASRVDREILRIKLPEEIRVQIAVDSLEISAAEPDFAANVDYP